MSSVRGVNVGGNLFGVTDSTNIAPIETTNFATRAYAKDRCFIMVDGLLYRATAEIESGDPIVINGNCKRTTLDEIISVIETDSDLIAPTEDGATSSADYAVGSEIVRSGILYKVISAITQGDAFAIGSNIEIAGSLTSQIQTLTNSIAPIEDGTNYSQPYNANQLFYHNGSLCYVTASSVNSSTAISIGDSGNANYCTLEWYLKNQELGVRLEHTWQASELSNVSSGSIQVINRDGVCCVKCVNLVCTADTPLVYLASYIGNVYEYDTNNSGLLIDNGTLYSKNANVGNRILTFVR